MEQADEELDGDGGDDAAAEAAAAKLSAKGAAAAGRGWHYNGDLSHVGGADDDDEEDEEEGGGAGGPGGRSVRAPSAGFVMPQVCANEGGLPTRTESYHGSVFILFSFPGQGAWQP